MHMLICQFIINIFSESSEFTYGDNTLFTEADQAFTH